MSGAPVNECEIFGIGYTKDIKKLSNFEHSLLKTINNEDLVDLVKNLKIESNLVQKASALLDTVSPFYISFLIPCHTFIFLHHLIRWKTNRQPS